MFRAEVEEQRRKDKKEEETYVLSTDINLSVIAE